MSNGASTVIDKDDVLSACVATGTRNISAAAEYLMENHRNLRPIVETGSKFAITSALNEVKKYTSGVLKNLTLNDLVNLEGMGGVVYCDPHEWLLGPADRFDQEHRPLKNHSNYVDSLKMYLTAYELMDNPQYRSEVMVGMENHMHDVGAIRNEYATAGRKKWHSKKQT